MIKKRSFLERLTGSIRLEDEDEELFEKEEEQRERIKARRDEIAKLKEKIRQSGCDNSGDLLHNKKPHN